MYNISVIIPVYNMEKYIRQCLQSVFNQTLNNIEVICIDDGSTDDTKKILDELKKNHANLRVFHQNRMGAGPARNLGLRVAEGEYIAFIDSDDYYPSLDVLEVLYNAALSNNVLMAGGNLLIDNGEFVTEEKLNNQFIYSDCLVDTSMYQIPYGFYKFIYSRTMLKNNGIKFPNLVRHQDPPFMLDAMIVSKNIFIISKDVYVLRVFDKKIDYSSENVIYDIIYGYLYMMKKTYTVNFGDTQRILINRIYNLYDVIVFHMSYGNKKVYDLIQEISNYLLDNKLKEDYDEFWSNDNICKLHNQKLNEIKEIDKKISGYSEIIIYGAGNYAKSFYDYISHNDKIIFLGFGISSETVNKTARGYDVKCISDYTDYKDSALVVIAVKEDRNSQMMNNAQKLGFKNIEYVNYYVGCYEYDNTTDGKFAFDN